MMPDFVKKVSDQIGDWVINRCGKPALRILADIFLGRSVISNIILRAIPTVPLIIFTFVNMNILLKEEFLPDENIRSIFGKIDVIYYHFNKNITIGGQSAGRERVVYCQDGWNHQDLDFEEAFWVPKDDGIRLRRKPEQISHLVFLSIRDRSEYAADVLEADAANDLPERGETKLIYRDNFIKRLQIGHFSPRPPTHEETQIIKQETDAGAKATRLTLSGDVKVAWIGASDPSPSQWEPSFKRSDTIRIRPAQPFEEGSVGPQSDADQRISCEKLTLVSDSGKTAPVAERPTEGDLPKGVLMVDLGQILQMAWNAVYGVGISLVLIFVLEGMTIVFRDIDNDLEEDETNDA